MNENDCGDEILSRFRPVGLLSLQKRDFLSKTFNSDALYDSSNHKLSHILPGHSGCINSLNWSKDGRFLASGSDDLQINIHSFSPGKDPEIVKNIKTAHYNNIFDVKFNPHFEDKLVSAAADGYVCIIDNWQQGRSDQIRSIRASTTDSAKTVEFIDANSFLVGCEDGRILQYDVRDPNPVSKIKYSLEEKQISIHSISKCDSAPHLLAVAGAEVFVRVFDIRGSHSVPAYTWAPPLRMDLDKSVSVPTGVRFSRFDTRLAVNYIKDAAYLIDPVNQRSSSDTYQALCRHQVITAPKLEPELEAWRIFNTLYRAGRYSEAEKLMIDILARQQRHFDDEHWVRVIYCELFNRVLCVGRLPVLHTSFGRESVMTGLTLIHSFMDHWPSRYLILMYFLTEGMIELCSRTCEVFLERAKKEPPNEWTEKIAHIASISAVCELDPAQIPRLIPRSFGDVCAQVPIIDLTTHPVTQKILKDSPHIHGYLSRFSGPLHERTFKGVSFVGDSDQFIGLGSDGGFAFLFPTKAGENSPCWAAKSDVSVVNVVEAHPFLPCIAVSGIDNTIKVWQPDCLLPAGQHQINPDYEAYQSTQIPTLIKNIPSNQGFNRLEDVIFNLEAPFSFFDSFF